MQNVQTIQSLLSTIPLELKSISDTPQLDVQLLLSHILQRSREFLLAHPEYVVTATEHQQFAALVKRRLSGEPMAYLLGHKQFWSLDLKVTPDTLVPRPETENLIEWVIQHFHREKTLNIADLGTGSGAIALALATESSHWQIDATDCSEAAIKIAQCNADRYQLQHVHFYLGDFCQALPPKKYALIVSNPPYIAEDDPHLPALSFEPQLALVAGATGLEKIARIIQEAPHYLSTKGTLLLEHGYNQAKSVHALLKAAGYQQIELHHDLAQLPRFTVAKCNCTHH